MEPVTGQLPSTQPKMLTNPFMGQARTPMVAVVGEEVKTVNIKSECEGDGKKMKKKKTSDVSHHKTYGGGGIKIFVNLV